MPLKAMPESQTKGKFRNTDPAFLKTFHSSQIFFALIFISKTIALKYH